jgi:polar amino acid transport system substrate-binding protein
MFGKSLSPPNRIAHSAVEQLLLILLCSCLFVVLIGSAFGQESGIYSHEIAPGVIHKHELSIAVSCAEPPYYGFNGFEGKEWGLVKTALLNVGHEARLYYLTAAEGVSAMEKGEIDAIWTCGSVQASPDGYYLSAPLLPRQCVAISLARNNLKIDTLDDLAGKKVAFHTSLYATMGPELGEFIANNPLVQSVANHQLLDMLLYNGRIDVLISELSVFNYNLQQLSPRVDTTQPLVFHNIFPVYYPRLVFKDEGLRDEFNVAWQVLVKQESQGTIKAGEASTRQLVHEGHDGKNTP